VGGVARSEPFRAAVLKIKVVDKILCEQKNIKGFSLATNKTRIVVKHCLFNIEKSLFKNKGEKRQYGRCLCMRGKILTIRLTKY